MDSRIKERVGGGGEWLQKLGRVWFGGRRYGAAALHEAPAPPPPRARPSCVPPPPRALRVSGSRFVGRVGGGVWGVVVRYTSRRHGSETARGVLCSRPLVSVFPPARPPNVLGEEAVGPCSMPQSEVPRPLSYLPLSPIFAF